MKSFNLFLFVPFSFFFNFLFYAFRSLFGQQHSFTQIKFRGKQALCVLGKFKKRKLIRRVGDDATVSVSEKCIKYFLVCRCSKCGYLNKVVLQSTSPNDIANEQKMGSCLSFVCNRLETKIANVIRFTIFLHFIFIFPNFSFT